LAQNQNQTPTTTTTTTVLGRFVFALNEYCKDVHAMEYDVEDYWVYEFAKASQGGRKGGGGF